ANYTEAAKNKQVPTPTMLFIEEAHEFLSAQRIAQMPVLFQQVARIARRGRKRWLGLAFITQLPQHLPDEVFGLVNNFVLHKISDASVIGRLKQTVPGIDASLWHRLPGLAPGQAIVSLTGMARPLLGAVRDLACVNKAAPSCGACPLHPVCGVSQLLATVEDDGPRGAEVPRPFVVRPSLDGQRQVAPGEPFGFGITLIGEEALQLF